MSAGDYHICPVCGGKALYDADEYGVGRPDVEVLHRDCLEKDRVVRENSLRRQIAQEVLDAGRGSWRNLAWMYPEQAAAVVLRLDAAVCDDHRLARSAVADVLARSTSDVSPSVAGEGPGRGPATSGNNTTVGENR
jgi:hypothetical protein